MSLPEEIADRILESVVDGRFPVGSTLQPEGELAATHAVSRLTIREAVRILRSKGVVEIRRGRGTFVQEPERWNSLDALVLMYDRQGQAVAERLLEARRMVEVGAAQLAAGHRTEEDLRQLAARLAEMRSGSERGDVDLFVAADLEFHAVVIRASENMFVPFMLEPFRDMLAHSRRQASAVPEIQQHAITDHQAILDALVSGDAERSRAAMEAHLNQAQQDLRTYVRHSTGGRYSRPDAVSDSVSDRG